VDGSQPCVSALRANRAGDSQGQWAWEKPSVRANCMLTGLEAEVERGEAASLLSVGCSPTSQPTIRPSILLEVKPPTGEPDAGDPHVRFGGRGSRELNRPSLPLSYGGPWRDRILRPRRGHSL